MRTAVLFLFLSFATSALEGHAERWVTETIAGTGIRGSAGDGGPAWEAQMDDPFGVVRGPDGAVYFCEYGGQRIRRVDADGSIVTIAGSGRRGAGGDGGAALEAEFNQPHEIRFDRHGDLFVADMRNHRIRKIEMKSGRITSIVGTGRAGFSGDGGLAVEAQLNQPHSIQFDESGRLYICDIGNHRIRRVDMSSGEIETFAGTGVRDATPDGARFADVPLNGPRTLDFDRSGNLWLALREGNQVFQLDLQRRTIHHVAGTGEKGFSGNGGSAREATLSGPKGIAVSSEGTWIYLVDTESHSIRRIHRETGRLELFCGTGEAGDGPDGNPLQCRLSRPHGIFIDGDGSVFVGDSESHRIRRIYRVE